MDAFKQKQHLNFNLKLTSNGTAVDVGIEEWVICID